ncbi:hypothetical protein ABT084_11285 [Streptomyces sp. NPDC002138]|uniref:hypothetical protein n=1 Tax=Streptomyces sp. NPDC002138 TaxID=3154410 RepID=UPI00332D8E00
MTRSRQRTVPLLDAVAAALRGAPGSVREESADPLAASPVPVVVLDEFLARPELDNLVEWVVGHEASFAVSGVITPSGTGRLDTGHRRSKVLSAHGPFKALSEERLMSALGHVRERLGMADFPVRQIEMQITASNDGEYFQPHTDNTHTGCSPAGS